MTSSINDLSPRVVSRAAGILYLLMAVVAPFSMLYVPSKLIVSGDATATANNIMASELLFRFSFVGDSIVFLSEIVLIVLLYVLFEKVSKILSLVAAFARLAMTVVQGMNLLNYFIVLLLISGASYLKVFGADQLHALMLLFLNAHELVLLIWGIFFSLHLLVLGFLVFKSGYFPRILGILLMLGFIGYLMDSFRTVLVPNNEVMPIIAGIFLVSGTIGELVLAFWLLIKGVDQSKMKPL